MSHGTLFQVARRLAVQFVCPACQVIKLFRGPVGMGSTGESATNSADHWCSGRSPWPDNSHCVGSSLLQWCRGK